MVALNCNHTIHLAKRLVPDMVARESGRILITGSVVSTSPNPYQAIYAATKAFVMSFGEALRVELEDTGVTVTVLQPGATDTNFFERADLMNTKVGQAEKDDPALVARRGFEAMIDGKDAVLGGGFKSRMQGFMNELLPETFKAKQAAKQRSRSIGTSSASTHTSALTRSICGDRASAASRISRSAWNTPCSTDRPCVPTPTLIAGAGSRSRSVSAALQLSACSSRVA